MKNRKLDEIRIQNNLKWIFRLRKSTSKLDALQKKKHKQFICQDFNRSPAFTRVLSTCHTYGVVGSSVSVCLCAHNCMFDLKSVL